MKLSLKKIFKETQEDLEAWSRQMEDDDTQVAPSPMQQTGADVQNLWGGVSLPADPKGGDSPGYDVAQLSNFIQKLNASGNQIGPQELKFLKSISPAGQIEDLVNDLENRYPNLSNQLLNLGLEQATINQSNQFQANPTVAAAGPRPAVQPQQVSQGQQASWDELIKQNPNYDTMRSFQKKSFLSSDEKTKPSINTRSKVAP